MNCTFNTFLYKFVSNFIKYSIITVIYFFFTFFCQPTWRLIIYNCKTYNRSQYLLFQKSLDLTNMATLNEINAGQSYASSESSHKSSNKKGEVGYSVININNKNKNQIMQSTQKQQPRGFNKRHYSSTTVTASASGVKHTSQSNITPKLPIFRKTDHTDDITSEATNSQANNFIKPHLVREEGNHMYVNEARVERLRRQSEMNDEIIYGKETKVVELRERLKNIHHFYKVRIQEQRNKNIQRSEIFIGVIQQLQAIHNQKILNLQKTYEGGQEGQQAVGFVDTRIENINKKVQQIITKSQQIKAQNQNLQQQILRKRETNQQKLIELQTTKKQLDEMRQRLQYFQKLKLKQNRRGKEMLEMINSVGR